MAPLGLAPIRADRVTLNASVAGGTLPPCPAKTRSLPVEVAVKLNGLAPSDIRVELLLGRSAREGTPVQHTHELSFKDDLGNGEARYAVELKPALAGRLDYRIRVYPRHELLTHPFELGLQCWV